jgi:hypothetical protein
MTDAASTPTKFSRSDLSGSDKPKCRVIVPPAQGGWSEAALFEWELTAESWTDEHLRIPRIMNTDSTPS